jgi:hypothetical protein
MLFFPVVDIGEIVAPLFDNCEELDGGRDEDNGSLNFSLVPDD